MQSTIYSEATKMSEHRAAATNASCSDLTDVGGLRLRSVAKNHPSPPWSSRWKPAIEQAAARWSPTLIADPSVQSFPLGLNLNSQLSTCSPLMKVLSVKSCAPTSGASSASQKKQFY